jgi:sensor histidine kinase YesM
MKMALKLKREIPLDLEDEIYSVLTSIYEQKENYKYANQSLHKRIEILKSVYAVQSNKIVNELESKYQLEKKQKEILSLVLEKRKKEISLKENERKIKYRNLLLFVFMALLLVTFIFFYFLYKQFQAKRNMNKTLELQNKAIREQKHRLEDTLESNRKLQRALKHDLGFYMQSALKKQMNPHFIFNSLISVQRFILQNDKLSASNYLADFSVLMRRVLENSQKELITYNEELNTLRLYIELEQRRFDGKFSYCEDIDSNIDLIACKIPPFILQPYIENAIWHGLLHKREEGHLHLKLKLSEEGNFVRCTIRDDGIGRKASNNRELKTNNYESLGLKITDKRIQAINSSSNLKLSVEILDLTAGNDVPVGTEVNLKIPLYSSTL